jgi:hypothetical protein
MRDLIWYAVQQDALAKTMKGVVEYSATDTSITYRKARSKPVSIDMPPDEELHLYAYGSMIMEGYTIVPSPDGAVHLCGGGDAVYSVTPTSCTCAGYTYSKGGAPCKHMLMLRGYEVHRLRAMGLRKSALSPITTGDT